MLLQSVMLSQADTWWRVAADRCMRRFGAISQWRCVEGSNRANLTARIHILL